VQSGSGGNRNQCYRLAGDATFFHGEDNFLNGRNKLIEFF
jgi:hypothetical protein